MERRVEEGVLISQREIYDLLLNLNQHMIVIQHDVKHLTNTLNEYEKRKEICNNRMDSLKSEQDKLTGLKMQVKLMWALLSVIVTSLMAVAFKTFEKGVQH